MLGRELKFTMSIFFALSVCEIFHRVFDQINVKKKVNIFLTLLDVQAMN
jgi:hypothetical protein